MVQTPWQFKGQWIWIRPRKFRTKIIKTPKVWQNNYYFLQVRGNCWFNRKRKVQKSKLITAEDSLSALKQPQAHSPETFPTAGSSRTPPPRKCALLVARQGQLTFLVRKITNQRKCELWETLIDSYLLSSGSKQTRFLNYKELLAKKLCPQTLTNTSYSLINSAHLSSYQAVMTL